MVFLLNEKAVCPCARGIKRRMEEMRVTIQEELKTLLRDEWVTIASDGWTSRSTDTYLGITYHFIDSDWEIKAVTVDCEKMSGSTTGEDLQMKIPKAWEKRGVAGVVANVTDCEPSMVKMGRLVMENTGIAHYGCVDHRLEKTAMKFYSHPSIAESLSRAQSIVNFLHKSSQVTYWRCLLFSLC
jgi:hypothetical protein